MVESTENEERVDFDEENYMEEMDDDLGEQTEEGVGDDNIQGGEEEDEDEEDTEDPRTGDSEKDQAEDDGTHISTEPEEYEEKLTSSTYEDDREKHAELLALPPHGSEVFIGGLPRGTLDGDLREHFEPIGEIFEIRLMKNKDTNEIKGYAFISFTTKEAAQKAIGELHNKEFKGKMLRCSLSEAKHRLFIGNVPKSLTEDEFRRVIEQTGPGAENIELIKDPQNATRNRGFAFVEYYNNACADYSRQKMTSVNFKLDGNTPTVTWADPKITSEHSAAASAQVIPMDVPRSLESRGSWAEVLYAISMLTSKYLQHEQTGDCKEKVKALYVKNIPDNTTTEQVKELFQRHGEVTKVVMPPSRTGSGKRDFGFIHYAERSSALKAVKDGEKYEINGQFLEVALAKPQSDKKSEGSLPHNSGHHPNYLPHPAYGNFAANPYGSLGAGYGATPGFQQPMIYGRGPMPAGMHMVPMVLPDGQIGYVLQQPGMQMPPPRSGRNDRTSGPGRPQGRGGSGGGGSDGNRGRRYRPY